MNRALPPFMLLLFLSSAGASADEPGVPAEPARQITVRLSEYQFTPSRIELKAGELVELTLINEGTVTHEFVSTALQALEVRVTVQGVVTETVGVAEMELAPRSRALLRFTPDKSGEYPVFCHANVPVDHTTKGMTGTLIVK